jgi:hypothetical protein
MIMDGFVILYFTFSHFFLLINFTSPFYTQIHTLLEEAENERMHLMTFLDLKQPTLMFRASVAVAQLVFWNFYFLSYLISPKFCHKMVGYLEEEAVTTYTKLIHQLQQGLDCNYNSFQIFVAHHYSYFITGQYSEWQNKQPPPIAMKYWKLREDATLVDLFKVIRADEAHHRDCNHLLSELKRDEQNPVLPGH